MANTLDQATVNSFLRGLRYPVSHDDLVHQAQVNSIPNELREALRELPLGEFGSMEEVVELLREQGYHIG